jgi:hypothetical protein
MGEWVTCGLIGLIAGGAAGYIAYVGVTVGEPVWLLLLIAVLLGTLLGTAVTFLTSLSKTEEFPSSVLLFGLILGGVSALVASIGVVVLQGIVPYFVVAGILGWFVGWVFCWLCDRRRDTHTVSAALPHG